MNTMIFLFISSFGGDHLGWTASDYDPSGVYTRVTPPLTLEDGNGITGEFIFGYGDIGDHYVLMREALTGDCVAAEGSSTLTCKAQTAGTAGSDVGSGKVGHVTSSFVNRNSAVSLSSATAKTVTTIHLDQGRHLISAQCGLGGALTIGLYFQCGISTSNNTMPAQGTAAGQSRAETPTVSVLNSDVTLQVGPYVVNVTAPSGQDFYEVEATGFTLGTAIGYGSLTDVVLPSL